MRRIQLHLEEELDDALAEEARRRGVSKAALIRSLLRGGFTGPSQDPVEAIIGTGDGEPAEEIDVVLYG